MLDLALLGFIAYLIYRIINKFFDNVEELFNRQSQQAQGQQGPSQPQQQQAQPKADKVASKKAQNKPMQTQSQIDRQQKVKEKQPQVAPKSSKSDIPVKDNQKIRTDNLSHKSLDDFIKLQLQIEKQQQTINEMNLRIVQYEQQKRNYVNRIEQIIQHVTSEQDQDVNEINQDLDNQELRAIYNLKLELNQAHNVEVEKFQEKERELRLIFEEQKASLQATYEREIKELKDGLGGGQQLASENTFVMNVHSIHDNDDLQDKINALEIELQVSRSQQESLRAQLLKNKAQPLERVQVRQINENQSNRENYQYKNQIFDLNNIIKNLEEKLQNLQSENERILMEKSSENQNKQKYLLIENDQIQKESKYATQISSLKLQKQNLQEKLIEINQLYFKKEEQLKEIEEFKVKRLEEQLSTLLTNLQKEKQDSASSYKKLTEAQSELEFVQMQLNQSQQQELSLKKQVQTFKVSSIQVPTSSITTSQVKMHPEFLKVKQNLMDLEMENKKNQNASSQYRPGSTISQAGKDFSQTEKRGNYARGTQQRQISPSFQMSPKQGNLQNNLNRLQTASSKNRMTSTIFTGVGNLDKMTSPIDLRYKTPLNPKTVAQSSIYEGGIIGESYFAQTCILNQNKKTFLIEQINKLKKISVKKTRLLYRSLNKYNKPISEYISNVPNILIVIELTSQKILSAFSQAAFSKELNSSSGEKRYVSMNKAMIIDVNEQKTYFNTSGTDTIRHEERSIIWGRNEFVVNSSGEEQAEIVCNMNCEGAIFQTDVSSEVLLNSETNRCGITQFQVYRIFLG